MSKDEILKLLEENRYADFFENLDNLGANKVSYYNDLKSKFISNHIEHLFNDQCRVFVSTFLKKDNNNLIVNLPNIEYDRNQFRKTDEILSEEYLQELLDHFYYTKVSNKYFSSLHEFTKFGNYIKNHFLSKKIQDNFIKLHFSIKEYYNFLALIFHPEDRFEKFDYTRDTTVYINERYNAELSKLKEEEEQTKLNKLTNNVEEAYKLFRITVKSELHI